MLCSGPPRRRPMTWLAPLLHGLWAFHIVRGELNQALTHAEEMETLGKTRGNLSALLLGKHERGRICLHRGEFTTARALFEQYGSYKTGTSITLESWA